MFCNNKFYIIIFINPGAYGNGNANVTCDVLIKKPDGSIYSEFKDVDVGKYKSAEGFLKLVLRGSKIVGVVLAHRFASELINNYALVIGKNIRVLRKIIFPIPGLAQINSLALEKFFRKKNGLKNALLRLSGKI